MFFVMHGEDLTHQRLHNHITKNILLLQPFNIILTKILIMNWRTSTTYVSMKIKIANKVLQPIWQFKNTSFTTGRSTVHTINFC